MKAQEQNNTYNSTLPSNNAPLLLDKEQIKKSLTSNHIKKIFENYASKILGSTDDIRKSSREISMSSLGMNLDTGEWIRRSNNDKGDIFSFIQKAENVKFRDSLKIAASFVEQARGQTQGTTHAKNTSNKDDLVPAYDQIKNAKALNLEQDLSKMLKYNNLEATYEYKDADGQLLGIVARFVSKAKDDEGKSKKNTMPVTYCQNKKTKEYSWQLKGFDDKGTKPIFGIEKLKDSLKPVLIVEGEKAALAATKMLPEYDVVSWMGGSASAGKPNWSQLKGKEVTIWPDHDEAGFKAADAIKSKLLASSHPADLVSIVKTKELNFAGTIHRNLLPEKWDLADQLPNSMTTANVREVLENTRSMAKEEPKIATITELEARQKVEATTMQEVVTQNKMPANTEETPKEEISKQEPSIQVTKKPVIEQIRLSEECSISGGIEEHQDMAYFNKKRAQELEFIKSERPRLTLNDLLPEKNPQGFTEYKTEIGDLVFTDKLSRIEFSMIGDKEKIALGLELACSKFGGRLQIKGLSIFKDKVLEVAAERNMDIVFVPRSLQERFEALKRGEEPTQNYITGDDTQQQKQIATKTQEKEHTKQSQEMAFDR